LGSRTIEFHRAHIMQKLGDRTLTEIQFIGPSSSVPKAVIADNNLGQALPKCGRGVCPVGGGAGVQKPNHRHARLLRVVGAYN
jgi:hypothetical protein